MIIKSQIQRGLDDIRISDDLELEITQGSKKVDLKIKVTGIVKPESEVCSTCRISLKGLKSFEFYKKKYCEKHYKEVLDKARKSKEGHKASPYSFKGKE